MLTPTGRTSEPTLPEHVAELIGPRQVGGRYRCWYWGVTYEVVAIDTAPAEPWMPVAIVERDLTGINGGRPTPGLRRHCTAWDPRDEVLEQPPG